MRTIAVIAVAVSLFASTNASAAPTVYTSLSAFNAAVTGQSTDTFDDLNANSPFGRFKRTIGNYSYFTEAELGFYYTGVGTDEWLGTNQPQTKIGFDSFTGGVSAIGGYFFNADIADNVVSGNVTLTLVDGSGATTQTIASTSATTFFGFVSTGPITSFSVRADDDGRYAEVNNLILGRNATATGAVPEPASWAMMMAGFALVGSAIRRRKATTAVRFA